MYYAQKELEREIEESLRREDEEIEARAQVLKTQALSDMDEEEDGEGVRAAEAGTGAEEQAETVCTNNDTDTDGNATDPVGGDGKRERGVTVEMDVPVPSQVDTLNVGWYDDEEAILRSGAEIIDLGDLKRVQRTRDGVKAPRCSRCFNLETHK